MNRKLCFITTMLIAVLSIAAVFVLPVKAAQDTIYQGIYIENIDVSGMTPEEATAAVQQYLATMSESEISLIVAQGQTVTVKIGDFGPTWTNPEVVEQATTLINEGNVIARYKMQKDIEMNGMVLPLQISFDDTAMQTFLTEQCSVYDIEVENATLARENDEFVVVGGQSGEMLDVVASATDLQNSLFTYYKEGTTSIPLIVNKVEPKGNEEELAQVTDVLGTFTTSYSTSGSNRSNNVANGCNLINGITLYPGEEFSTYETLKPFTEENGYYLAGSYLNGQVVDSLGGGICQVSSTLYNAVLRAELEVTQRHSHSMIVSYVQRSADAAIAESSGKDFTFVNNTDYPIYIEGYTENKQITFNIYGVETRPSNRTIEFVSETLSETVPDTETIVADPGQGIGYFSIQSAHIGYKAKLWKVVYEDGVEVSRTEVNSSSYSASPRTAVVGVNTANADYYNRMMAAVATGSIDQCKATADQIIAEATVIQAQQQQDAQQQQPQEGQQAPPAN